MAKMMVEASIRTNKAVNNFSWTFWTSLRTGKYLLSLVSIYFMLNVSFLALVGTVKEFMAHFPSVLSTSIIIDQKSLYAINNALYRGQKVKVILLDVRYHKEGTHGLGDLLVRHYLSL